MTNDITRVTTTLLLCLRNKTYVQRLRTGTRTVVFVPAVSVYLIVDPAILGSHWTPTKKETSSFWSEIPVRVTGTVEVYYIILQGQINNPSLLQLQGIYANTGAVGT